MAYTRVNWEDLPSTNTPRNATNLNKMDAGIKENDDKLLGNSPMGSIVVDDVNCKNMFVKGANIVTPGYLNASGNVVTTDATLSYQNKLISVQPNTQYTISSNTSTIYRIAEYNQSGTFITRQYNADAGTSYTFTTGANTYFIKMGGTLTTVLDSLQIEEGDTATEYVEGKKIIKEKNGYVKENTTFYANDFKCRNLFNKNNVNKLNAYFNEGTPTITSNSSNRTLYIPCKSNTTYTITIPDGTGAYAIGYTSTLPALNTSVSGVSNTLRTITTDANAKYLVMRYFQTAQATITEQQALDGIQIEVGSEATPYTPYKNFENEEIYSTNEMVIGRWIDGKPLYRKVIEISITTAGDYTYNVASLNIDTTVFFNGYCYVENQTTTKRPLPYITWNNNVNKTLVCSIESFDNNNIYCKSNWNNSKIFLSLEYTKTTD